MEAGLLGSRACAQLVAAGVPVPAAHHGELEPHPARPLESRFALLLSDFAPDDGWRQDGALSAAAARAALGALAQLHGFFWEGSAFWRQGGAAGAAAAGGAAADGAAARPAWAFNVGKPL